MAQRSTKTCYICGKKATTKIHLEPPKSKRKGDVGGWVGVCKEHNPNNVKKAQKVEQPVESDTIINIPASGCEHRWAKVAMGYNDEGGFDVWECLNCGVKENRPPAISM